MNKKQKFERIDTFDFEAGTTLAGKYKVLLRLGSGWEGEVYKILELRTGIERAAKIFYPQRNINNRTSRLYARKLHKLRHCPILIQYHTDELIKYRKIPVTMFISEYVEGRLLSEFLDTVPGKRLAPFEALHLLYSLTMGMQSIHQHNEYHGDLHLDNIIVCRHGLTFDLKLLDLFHLETPKAENRQADILDVIRVFYDSLGGAKYYSKQPDVIKYLCSGLKHSLILRKFRTMYALSKYLETMQW